MIRRPPRSTRTDTLVPYTTLFRSKRVDWATSWAKYLDNACLAVTAAESGVTVPFTSVYKAIRTTNADTSYTADDNYVATATGSALTYDNLSAVLGRVEGGDYWEESLTLVIAHPSLRERIRNKIGNAHV